MNHLNPNRVTLLLGAGLLFVTGCVSTTVDYAPLERAANERQRAAGVTPMPDGDVRALLSKPLTAESAVRIALLNNRGLRAALEQVSLARSELAGAARLPNPTVEGAVKFHGDDDPSIELGAMLDLTELGFLLPRRGAALSGVDAATAEAVGAIVRLSFEAREAFLDHEAAVQTLALRKAAGQALAASADMARRLREAGNITELSNAQEQSLFQESRLAERSAELGVRAARERLNAILGLSGHDILWKSAGRLPDLPESEVPTDRLETEAVRRSLELEALKQRYTAAGKRANIAGVGGFLPELKAGVTAEREESWAVGPAVELEVPLFYQGQGEAGAARAEMRRQQYLYEDTAIRLRATARDVAAQLAVTREASLYYRDVLVPLKQKILDETLLHYNAMSIGTIQLLQAKRDQLQTAENQVEQLRQYWVARTRALSLLAGHLPAGAGASPVVESSTPRKPDAH